MPGLCTAWFLQQQGPQVTVLERAKVGAGASAGNAGWITPALVSPLPTSERERMSGSAPGPARRTACR
jgi:glycine/D-amino acid oxidase-like deaminating enzyme